MDLHSHTPKHVLCALLRQNTAVSLLKKQEPHQSPMSAQGGNNCLAD